MKRGKGFTLIEAIVTICIVAVLAGVGIFALTQYIDKAQAKACLVNRTELMRDCADYIALFKLSNNADTVQAYVSDEVRGGLTAVCPAHGTCTVGWVNGEPYIFCDKHADEGVTPGAPPPADSQSVSSVMPELSDDETVQHAQPAPNDPFDPNTFMPDPPNTGSGSALLGGDVQTTAGNVAAAFVKYLDDKSITLEQSYMSNQSNSFHVAGSQYYVDVNYDIYRDALKWGRDEADYEAFQSAVSYCRVYFTKGGGNEYYIDYVYIEQTIDNHNDTFTVDWAKVGRENKITSGSYDIDRASAVISGTKPNPNTPPA